MSILSKLKVPVFTAGGIPEIDLAEYRLSVKGLIENPMVFSLSDIQRLPQNSISARLLSVSGWSVRATWEGVLWNDFIKLFRLKKEAYYVKFISYGGEYFSTVSLEKVIHPRSILVLRVNGEPLEKEYGGPLRIVLPHLYGYKSPKWLSEIVFVEKNEGGYWEERGYPYDGEIAPGFTLDINTGNNLPIKGGEVEEF